MLPRPKARSGSSALTDAKYSMVWTWSRSSSLAWQGSTRQVCSSSSPDSSMSLRSASGEPDLRGAPDQNCSSGTCQCSRGRSFSVAFFYPAFAPVVIAFLAVDRWSLSLSSAILCIQGPPELFWLALVAALGAEGHEVFEHRLVIIRHDYSSQLKKRYRAGQKSYR